MFTPGADLYGELCSALREAATPERATKEKAYLKSDREHLGVRVPAVRSATKALAKQHRLDRSALWALVDRLWSSGIHELAAAAVELLQLRPADLLPDDLPRLETMIREARTWALVDPLAVHVVGALFEAHPELGDELDRWCTDDDFWVRRASMLALLGPLRRGEGDWDRFCRYADRMLEEKEFFIRKAIGWILRETARKRPDDVFAWIAPRTHRSSGVTMREVVKRVGDERGEALMAAYRAGEPLITR
jgi:3-methyladenine DNA glycosylase AlkD